MRNPHEHTHISRSHSVTLAAETVERVDFLQRESRRSTRLPKVPRRELFFGVEPAQRGGGGGRGAEDGPRNFGNSFRLRIKISLRRMSFSSAEQKQARARAGAADRFRRENLITKRRRLGLRPRYRRGISKRLAGSCGERNFGGRQCAPILIAGNPSSTKGWKRKKNRTVERLAGGGGGRGEPITRGGKIVTE